MMSLASTAVLRPGPSNLPSQCFIYGASPLENRLATGSQLFGNNAAWFILGFLAIQTHTYYVRSANDHPIFKTFVYIMVFIAMAESVVEGITAYGYLILGWGNPLLLDVAVVTFNLQPVFDALPALFVQIYFVWRIWTFCMAFGGRMAKIIVASICAFVILTGICALISVLILTLLFVNQDREPPGVALLGWTVSTVVADLTITACMMVILYHAKSRACFGETRDKIDRLLRLTVQTGFLTSILALPIAPLYFRREAGVYALTGFLLGKSYVISLLANLNARTYRPPLVVTKGDGVNNPVNPQFSSMAFSPGQNPSSTVANTTGFNGVLSFIRSVARTIHNEPIEPIPQAASTEYTSRPDAEVQRPVRDLTGYLHGTR